MINDVIFVTRDAHPKNHCSFKEQGGLWNEHCVVGTEGFKFHRNLLTVLDTFKKCEIIDKATQANKEAYSGFDGTNLADKIREYNIGRLIVVGVATEYCVKATVLDAIKKGFEVWLVLDGIASVNQKEGDKAILEMQRNGAIIAESNQVREARHLLERTGLLVVDLQNDFFADGALPVQGAESVFSAIGTLIT